MEHPLKTIEMRIALIISLVVHVFIGLICYYIHTELSLQSVEYTEMSFIASSARDLPMTVENPLDDMNPLLSEPVSPVSETIPQLADPVQLPKLRDSEQDEDELIKRDYGKLDAGETVKKIEIASDEYDRNVSLPETPASGEKKAFVLPGQSVSQNKPSPLQNNDRDVPAQNQPYTIEGEAAERRILYQEIPKYPAGLQKEATVKIRITVLPDGKMGPVIPMQKGDPTLEEVTIKALRQWRFDPLPSGVAQKNVQGIVTFRYELR
jgi:TonB family protein